MPFNFLTSQKNTLTSLFNDAKAGRIPYGNVYDYIANVGIGQAGVDPASIAWLKGAAEVNRGEGTASVFIRKYTEVQQQIRLGKTPTAAEMQATSNKIAKNVIEDALSIDVNGIPSLTSIAEDDANNAASDFFNGDKAGWSGNVLFLVLGYTQAFDANLINDAPGNSYDLLAAAKAMKAALDTTGFLNSLLVLGDNFSYQGAVDIGASTIIADNFLGGIYGAGVANLALLPSTRIILDTLTTGSKQPLVGTNELDYIHAAGGDDTIKGSRGNDIIDGGDGIDMLDYTGVSLLTPLNIRLDQKGSSLSVNPIVMNIEQVIGSNLADTIIGSNQDNTIDGGAGNDSLDGGDGQDKLDGGDDNDTLTGGADNDTYVLSSGNEDAINDTGEGDEIEDFAGEATEKGEGTGIYELNGAELQDVNGDLVIRRGSDVTYVWGWVDGDYGITLEEKDEPDDDIDDAVDNFPRQSPIALDINKSGRIETTLVTSSKTYFDIDNDNFSERVEWIAGGDGWLVRDLNTNGKIDNQNELFGDGGGLKAYQKLAALNTNNTGTSANLINSADSAWGSLRVWIDANANGVSETAELKTLASLGITSLSLESSVGSLKSTFVMNGTTYNAQDIFVASDQMDSWYKGTAAEITPLSLTLPRSRGYGDVKSLHYAASSSSTLTTKLQELDNLPISGLDSYYSKLEAMVGEWTGANLIGMNNHDPMAYLAMEKFSGIVTADSPWGEIRFERLEYHYNKMMSELSSRIIAQGTLANVFGNPTYSFSDDGLKFSLSHTQILANAIFSAPVDTVDKKVYWSEIARTLIDYSTDFGITTTAMQTAVNSAAGYNVNINNSGYDVNADNPFRIYIRGTSGNNSLIGGAGDDPILAREGNDTVWGSTGNDWIYGDIGNDILGGDQDNDTIWGGDGNDTIYGWTGNDYLSGDEGDYTFNGKGNDVINGEDGNDTIIGGIGSDLIYGGNGNDSISESAFSSGSIDNNTIYGEAGNDRIENNSNFAQLYGGIGDDTIIGGFGNDTIYGGDGNDRLEGNGGLNLLYGDAGNDVIIGGTGQNTIFGGIGADTITGGTGNEIFRYASGDGDDVIKKASTTTTADVLELTNIARSGVTFSAVNNFSAFSDPNSVRINITGGGSILLENYLDGTNSGRISSLKFSDSVVMTTAQIAQAAAMSGTSANDTITGGAANDIIIGHAGADSLSGSAGNDSIYGGSGADILRGGLGNDLLKGGEDSDTYFYAKGDGDDAIVDFFYSSLQGVLRLENITRSEASFASVDTNADGTVDSIKLNVGGGGSITLQDQLNTLGNIDFFNIVFSDGTTMNAAQIKAATPVIGTSGNDTLFGDSGNNNISALGGNDQIVGGDGNDSLSGDLGNDSIWGDAGNDTIAGGVGVDYLVGGTGADRFTFNKGDTGIGNNIDEIADFNRSQGDKIALLGYGLNASGFKGTSAMAAGGAIEFNYSKVAAYNYTIIRIDADNNGTSDQEIVLTGLQLDLTASDFQFV
jgi:Ca2+-binding RTX toxin-like protein